MKKSKKQHKPFDHGMVSLRWVRLNLGQDAYQRIRDAIKADRLLTPLQRVALAQQAALDKAAEVSA